MYWIQYRLHNTIKVEDLRLQGFWKCRDSEKYRVLKVMGTFMPQGILLP